MSIVCILIIFLCLIQQRKYMENEEASNVAKYYPKVVKIFTATRLEEYAEFNMNKKLPSKQDTLAQIESYNCKENMGYHLS